MVCRVPWRLAAYLKDVGETQATAEGIFDVMKAQKEFFEDVLSNGNTSLPSNDKRKQKARTILLVT